MMIVMSSKEHGSHWHSLGTVISMTSFLNGAGPSGFGHITLTFLILVTASLHWLHVCVILNGFDLEICARVTHDPTHARVRIFFDKQSL